MNHIKRSDYRTEQAYTKAGIAFIVAQYPALMQAFPKRAGNKSKLIDNQKIQIHGNDYQQTEPQNS